MGHIYSQRHPSNDIRGHYHAIQQSLRRDRISPLSHRVQKARAASVRTSLQGLDYFTAEGNNLVFIIDKNLFDSKY